MMLHVPKVLTPGQVAEIRRSLDQADWVEPVTRGTRVCAFFWTRSMVRDDWQRSILFELDQNIQQLRARTGDCAEIIGLTGHYHNLLRQWADL